MDPRADAKPGDDDWNECESCGYETRLVAYTADDHHETGKLHWYCDVCASSYISNMSRYPAVYDYQVQMLARSIGYVVNMILDAIREHGRRDDDADGR